MTILPALLLFSLVLVAAAVVLFVYSATQGDCLEAERLCLMPLEDDAAPAPRCIPSPDSRSKPDSR